MNFIRRFRAEILVGVLAILAGLTSFWITRSILIAKISRKSANQVVPDNEVKVALMDEKQQNEMFTWTNENVQSEMKEYELVNREMMKDVLKEEVRNQVIELEEIQEEMGANAEENETVEEEKQEEKEQDGIFIGLDYEANSITELASETSAIEKSEKQANMIEAITHHADTQLDYPISGEVLLELAKDKLVYSETLEEWITHDGVDIKGEVAEPVKAVLAGMVESVKWDPRYGNTIIIRHNDHLKTVYANLSTLDLVFVGKQVETGEIISGVGEGVGFESEEGPHVHFEIVET